jgi:hypothetical protein
MLNNEFKKAIHDNKYEVSDGGLYLPKAKVTIGGVFTTWITRDGEVIDKQEDHNLVVDEGLNYIIGVALTATTDISAFYIGLFGNNYTPIAANVQSNATASNNFSDASKAGEVTTAYSETYRQTWTGVLGSKIVTNAAAPCAFTANTGVTVYGAFLTGGSGSNTKAAYGAGHTLVAASLFGSSRALINTDVLNVTYALSVTGA